MRARRRGSFSIAPYMIGIALVMLGLSTVLPSWGPGLEGYLLKLGVNFQPVPAWLYSLLAYAVKLWGWAIIGVTAVFAPLYWWFWRELL